MTIGGFPLEVLAHQASFEEVVYLLWYGRLPTAVELKAFIVDLAGLRTLPAATLDLLGAVAAKAHAPMDALRMAIGTVDLDTDDPEPDHLARLILARMPVIVAAYHRLRTGQAPVAPDSALGHAANYLAMLTGAPPPPAQVRGLETYLNTVIDHGLNASTFAARVIIATQSDLVSAITGAVGALKGPLHGGAPGPALDMVFEIGEAEHAEAYLRKKLDAGERLMGFGHRVYKVRDPRADVLGAAAESMYADGGDMALYRLARDVEWTRPGIARGIQTGPQLADQCGVLHGVAPAWPRSAHRPLHPHLCRRTHGRLDRPLLRAESDGQTHPTKGRLRRGVRSRVDTASPTIGGTSYTVHHPNLLSHTATASSNCSGHSSWGTCPHAVNTASSARGSSE